MPLLYGPYMAKVSVAPVSPELVALAGERIETRGKPNALRDSVNDFFGSRNGEWEPRVQLCTDRERMPVEDASVPWPEAESPYVAVARIVVTPQEAWTSTRSRAVTTACPSHPGTGWRRTGRSAP